jgi:hypothetical protein
VAYKFVPEVADLGLDRVPASRSKLLKVAGGTGMLGVLVRITAPTEAEPPFAHLYATSRYGPRQIFLTASPATADVTGGETFCHSCPQNTRLMLTMDMNGPVPLTMVCCVAGIAEAFESDSRR